jgi:hypothetical protein
MIIVWVSGCSGSGDGGGRAMVNWVHIGGGGGGGGGTGTLLSTICVPVVYVHRELHLA